MKLNGFNVIVFGQAPIFKNFVIDDIQKQIDISQTYTFNNLKHFYSYLELKNQLDLPKSIKVKLFKLDIKYVDTLRIFCESRISCKPYFNNRLIMMDSNHLNQLGGFFLWQLSKEIFL